MIDLTNIFIDSLRQLGIQLAIWLPKLIIALFIWWIGRYLLVMGSHWIKKIDIPNTRLDNKILAKINQAFLFLGKLILLLIVLDYLGIGRNIVAAVANGLTLSIAIAVGLSFGRAFENDAQTIVKQLKKYINK